MGRTRTYESVMEDLKQLVPWKPSTTLKLRWLDVSQAELAIVLLSSRLATLAASTISVTPRGIYLRQDSNLRLPA